MIGGGGYGSPCLLTILACVFATRAMEYRRLQPSGNLLDPADPGRQEDQQSQSPPRTCHRLPPASRTPPFDGFGRSTLEIHQSALPAGKRRRFHTSSRSPDRASTHAGIISFDQNVRGGLAPRQQKRATELLDANPDGNISLSEVAMQCRLSVHHFDRRGAPSSQASARLGWHVLLITDPPGSAVCAT
jgi:hypothetical protein